MFFSDRKKQFEKNNTPLESSVLTFSGIGGLDVYNPSIPFTWDGVRYIYGRVERRDEWANSSVRLFKEVGRDIFDVVNDSPVYQLEDPFISCIGNELVLGGTHVRYRSGVIDTYYGYFFKGTDINNLRYFTTGPDEMKDIRLVQLSNGIGVFSRPRGADVEKEHGSSSIVGFTVINEIMELNADTVTSAKKINGMFNTGEWGGCNQCYLLDSGKIGIIAHKSYGEKADNGITLAVYVNVSFVFDPERHLILDEKILAARRSYPGYPAKKPELTDCAFTAGIVMRDDGRADLYSGLGDTCAGRVVIDYPFEGFGKIVTEF